jgi:hypothetical protein
MKMRGYFSASGAWPSTSRPQTTARETVAIAMDSIALSYPRSCYSAAMRNKTDALRACARKH